MKKTYLFFTFTIFICFPIFSQEITNIHFELEGKKINIYYDLSGKGIFDINIYYSNNNGKTWGKPLTHVSGAVGNGQKAGKSNLIIWDVLGDLQCIKGHISFKVEAIYYDYSGISGVFTDFRDGKTYKWVKIGNQIWMGENLNFKTASGSWCYSNQESNCTTYGRYYSWDAAIIACPNEWHLPKNEEWNTLIAFLGKNAGGKLKEVGISHWDNPNISATNSSGFTALPGGMSSNESQEMGQGSQITMWSSSENGRYDAWILRIYSNSEIYQDFVKKSLGFSVRCIKD